MSTVISADFLELKENFSEKKNNSEKCMKSLFESIVRGLYSLMFEDYFMEILTAIATQMVHLLSPILT